jgi:hypothetical protein
MFRKISLLFIVLLAIYVIMPDTDISPAATQWLMENNRPVADEDNLFNALAGLTVAADENMVSSGTLQINKANRVLAEFLKTDEHLQSGSKPQFDSHWTRPALVPTEETSLICDPRAQDCRDIWISQKDIIHQLLSENEILLNRYRELQNYPYYLNTLAIDVRSPVPDYSTLMTLNRLNGAGIALRYITSPSAETLDELDNDMLFLRRLISQADTLIVKMVALSMLKHDLYLYASLIDTHPGEFYLFDEISVLTENEKSLEKPVKYEFRMNSNLVYEIKKYPELITGQLAVPAWLPFPLFRANHSINMIHRTLSYNLDKSRLPPDKYYQQYSPEDEIRKLKPGWLSYVYNPIGCILFTLSIPDFSKYITRIHDMNGLIHMVNLKRQIKRNNTGLADMEKYVKQAEQKYFNPYTGKHFDWNPGEQTLSFRSPGSEYVSNKLDIVFPDTAAVTE